MDTTLYVRVREHRRISKRGQIQLIKGHDRFKPRPYPRR